MTQLNSKWALAKTGNSAYQVTHVTVLYSLFACLLLKYIYLAMKEQGSWWPAGWYPDDWFSSYLLNRCPHQEQEGQAGG